MDYTILITVVAQTQIYSNHETNLVGEIMGGLVLHWPPLLILKAMSLAAKQGRAIGQSTTSPENEASCKYELIDAETALVSKR